MANPQKSVILKAFNTLLFEFFDDIIRIFPEKNEIPDAKQALLLLKQANPVLIIRCWNKYITVKYSDVITNGNIDFFFNKDYKDDVKNLVNSDKVIAVIDTLREPVSQLSDNSKDMAMKYIQNLSKLTTLYYSDS
jgi:hypothetical protein